MLGRQFAFDIFLWTLHILSHMIFISMEFFKSAIFWTAVWLLSADCFFFCCSLLVVNIKNFIFQAWTADFNTTFFKTKFVCLPQIIYCEYTVFFIWPVDERLHYVILPKALLCLPGVIFQDQKHNFLLYLIMDINMRSL